MARDALFDGVVDIEQLEVEEHPLAGRQQRLAEVQPVAAIEQLVADLVEIDAVAEPRDQTLRLASCVEVEGDDQGTCHGDVSGFSGHCHASAASPVKA